MYYIQSHYTELVMIFPDRYEIIEPQHFSLFNQDNKLFFTIGPPNK